MASEIVLEERRTVMDWEGRLKMAVVAVEF